MDAAEKTKAFRLFDFESEDRWKQFLLKVDISGPNYNAKLLRLKAKWYKREIDPVFDVSWLQQHGAANLQAESSSTAEKRAKAQNNADSNSNPAPTTRIVPSQAAYLILLHIGSSLLGMWSLLPLSSAWLHTYFLQLVVLTSVFKVLQSQGRPTFRPLSELKMWFVKAMSTTDCQYGFMALLFMRSAPTRLAFLPPTVLATYHVIFHFQSVFGQTNLWKRFGKRTYDTLLKRQNGALMLNAVAEIGVGFVMVLRLFTNITSITSAFLYWHWLRFRYHSVDASWFHRQAWSNIGKRVDPLLAKVPFLKAPVSYAQKWFTNIAQ